MQIRLLEVETFERPVRLRLPFRFGVIVLKEAPQMFLRCRVQASDGREAFGMAAEMLAPKWFDKNPELSNEQNFDQLRDAVRLASEAYLQEREPSSPFELFINHYADHLDACWNLGLNSLVAGFGSALLDRAVLDAVCRIAKVSFWECLQGNLPGLCPHREIADLGGFDFESFLAVQVPLRRVQARHTVGLADPIHESDQPPGSRINDGLPETLSDVIDRYGQSYFKVKVTGNVEEDVARLESIADVLTRCEDYRVTLDGNEQFKTREQLIAFFRHLGETRSLERFCRSILFVEQPLDRRVSWEEDLTDTELGHALLIDESDGVLEAFPRARGLGYRGVSSKGCKGVYKSVINKIRCHIWNQQSEGSSPYFMSAEDLTTQPGLAVQQDLALAAFLGLSHVERNGHHYVKGFQGAPRKEQEAFLEAHRDLYERLGGETVVRIRGGELVLESLGGPGFATGVHPDVEAMETGMELMSS